MTTLDVGGIDFALPLSTPAGLLGSLKSLIIIPAFGVDPVIAPSLTADVNAALAALAKGGKNANKTAANNMNALINHTKAQAGKKITAKAATEIIKQANAIIAALGK